MMEIRQCLATAMTWSEPWSERVCSGQGLEASPGPTSVTVGRPSREGLGAINAPEGALAPITQRLSVAARR